VTEGERLVRRTTTTSMSTTPTTMSTEPVTMSTEPVAMDEPATMESSSMTSMEARFEIDRGWDDE
jgi:hypothetical protein